MMIPYLFNLLLTLPSTQIAYMANFSIMLKFETDQFPEVHLTFPDVIAD